MHSTTIDPDTTLATLVETDPAFVPVFETVGLDYCCGGKRSLEAACSEADLDLETVLERLGDAAMDGVGTQADDADGQPGDVDRSPDGVGVTPGVDHDRTWTSLTQLANLIVWEHHRYLRRELPELEDLAETVARVHGDTHPELRTLETELEALAAELADHIAEEEQVAFPIVKRLDDGQTLSQSDETRLREEIETLEADHDETATRLERLADLTDEYAVPEDACGSYRQLFARLERLEENTHLHVHRENNVLFPRAETLLAES